MPSVMLFCFFTLERVYFINLLSKTMLSELINYDILQDFPLNPLHVVCQVLSTIFCPFTAITLGFMYRVDCEDCKGGHLIGRENKLGTSETP